MKTVFANHREVCHIWAQQKQSEGRASRIFFDGPVIFSYGRHFPMARFVDHHTVLMTTRGYSVSTAKHMSYVRQSLPNGIKLFRVRDVLTADHASNAFHLVEDIKETRNKSIKAKSNKSYLQHLVLSKVEHLREYVQHFSVKPSADVKALLNGDALSPETLAAIERKLAEDRKAKVKETKEEKKALMERADKWKAGENVSFPYQVHDIFLRVKGDEIETSKGARIPLAIARRLWGRIKGTDMVLAPVAGMSLGHYTVNSWDGETLRAGCHTIQRSEMERLAEVLKW